VFKKILAGLTLLSAAFFFTFGISHAETVTSGDMYKAFEKQYKTANYDFKDGSLELHHVKTINLDQPIKVKKDNKEYTISKITVAVASYKTVRDYIFLKDWNEYAYYAPEEGLILTEGDVMNITRVQDFQHQYDSFVRLELGPIVLLMLLVIIVPVSFGWYWKKKKYNTLDFRLKLLEAADRKH